MTQPPGRTEDRLDLAEFGEDLPRSLPHLRPHRRAASGDLEVEMYEGSIKVLRRFRRRTFSILGLTDPGRKDFGGGSAAVKLDGWDAFTQTEWNKAVGTYLQEMQGYTDAPGEGWLDQNEVYPKHWRLAMNLGVDRAHLLTGDDEPGVRAVAPRRWLQDHAFERISPSGQSRVGAYLTDADRPGGSILGVIQDGLREGQGPGVMAKNLSEQFDGYERYEFERLARTEVAFAQEESLKAELRAEGYQEIPGLAYPPFHPNACLPGTRVSGCEGLAIFRAFYVGPAVELTLANGTRLSVTVQHPLLTPGGWVAAGGLCDGDHLVDGGSPERVLIEAPDDDQLEPRIEDIFAAASVSPGMTTTSVPATSEHLHGDGGFCQGEVDIVAPDGFLGHGVPPSVPEHPGDESLGRRSADALSLTSGGDLSSVLVRLALAADAGMGISDPSPLLLDGDLCERHAALLAHASDRHVAVSKARGKYGPADSGLLREALETLSGQVSLLEIVEVRHFHFAGHVYDLQSSATAYLANGVVSSNCLCSVVVDMELNLIVLDIAATACPICQPHLAQQQILIQDNPNITPESRPLDEHGRPTTTGVPQEDTRASLLREIAVGDPDELRRQELTTMGDDLVRDLFGGDPTPDGHAYDLYHHRSKQLFEVKTKDIRAATQTVEQTPAAVAAKGRVAKEIQYDGSTFLVRAGDPAKDATEVYWRSGHGRFKASTMEHVATVKPNGDVTWHQLLTWQDDLPVGLPPRVPVGTPGSTLARPKPKPVVAPKPEPVIPKPKLPKAEWEASLTDGEWKAIRGWTDEDYPKLRNVSSGKTKNGASAQYARMEGALDRAEPDTAQVYRGLVDIPDEEFAAMREMDIVESQAIASASKLRDEAEEFASMAGGGEYNSAMLIFEKQQNGVDISGIAVIPGEEEVVLRRGIRYRVRKRSIEGPKRGRLGETRLTLYLEEVP